MTLAPKVDDRFSLAFVPVLKAAQGPDGKRRLHGVASSTVRDRHGDVMSKSALEDMLEQSNRGLTIFLNHSYNVPEDVAGTVERAILRQVAADIHDLSFDIVINERNPRAIEAWEAMHEQGTKLGLSIGAMIPEGGAKVDRKTGAYTIDHVELVETSIVGVPANPRSWVEYAAKALRKADSPTTTTTLSTWIDSGTASVWSSDNVWRSSEPKQDDRDEVKDTEVEPPPIHPTPDEEYEPPAEPVTTDDINDGVVNEDGSDQAEAERKKNIDQTPQTPRSDLPEQDDRDEVKDREVEPPPIEPTPDEEYEPPAPAVTTDDLLDLADKAAGQAKTKTTVTVETPFANVTVDTGRKAPADANATSQEAPESAPETEESAVRPEAPPPWMGIPGNPPVQQEVDLTSITAKELTQSAQLVTSLSSELHEVRLELSNERNLRLAAERERDSASRDLTRVLRETKELLDKLAATPVGRRAGFHEAVGRYEAIKAYYGEEFTDHLARSME